YISIKNDKFKTLYYKKEVIFILYLTFFLITGYVLLPQEIFLVVIILVIFLWMIIFDLYYHKVQRMSEEFIKHIEGLILKKNTLQEKVFKLEKEIKGYQKQLNIYNNLFRIVQEINENIELNKIVKEFYTKIVNYFGQEKIFYLALVVYKKKDIINTIEYPTNKKDIVDMIKNYLLGETNLDSTTLDYNLFFYELYSNKNSYMIVIAYVKEEEISSELNFFISETKIGFVRSILFNEVENLARIDGLTELYLRRFFINRLNDELLRALRYNTKFSLIMLDIDFFKKINDTYGHIAGDFVLKKLAKITKDIVAQQGLCSRWGGEEFLIFIPYQSQESVKNLAEELRQKIENINFIYENKTIKLTISCGISFFPEEAKDIKTLIEIADKKLYQAKQSGRNKVVA
ncbi:MAG: GGDEF domain-containing protein, partial [Endomicrobiia bacterium]